MKLTLCKQNVNMEVKPKQILIADDEPDILEIIRYNLEKEGYEVHTAKDGNEAIEKAKQLYPDLIILDIMMPMVDGFATLEQIRRDDNLQHTKVMFLSAKNKESDIEKGMALGADAYMTKPFSIKKVIEKVEELLN